MKKYLLYFFLAFFFGAGAQVKPDSLQRLLNAAQADTEKVKLLLKIAMHYGSNDPEKALAYASRAAALAESAHFDQDTVVNAGFKAMAYRSQGMAHYFLGDYPKAIERLNKAVNLFEKAGDGEGLAGAYGWLGNTYYSKADFEKALEALLRALKIQEKLNNRAGIGASMNGIANIYHRQHNLAKALEYYFKSLVIKRETTDSVNVAYCYNNIGLAYAEAGNLAQSLEYHLKCLRLVEKHQDKKGMANSYGNIGELYMKQEKFADALTYLFKSLAISQEISDRNGIAASYYAIGLARSAMGELKKALEALAQALAVSQEIGDLDATKDAHRELALVYKRLGDYPFALRHLENYMQIKDSLMNEGNIRNLEEMQTRFETEKKEQEIQLLQKDQHIRELQLSEQQANINRQRIVIYSATGGLLLVVALIFFIWKSYREKQRINTGLERKNKEIHLQKELIEEKNTLITDSIDYARNIQQAILPSDQAICAHLPDAFIFFQPKDIVSGDFYWMKACPGDKVLFAAVDCTGHGVPGAFMSVMAYNMLENILADKHITQPALILDALNRSVLETLRQDNENATAKYGMDISLICWDKRAMQVEFAGAHNPLLIVSSQAQAGGRVAQAAATPLSLTEVKADKTTMGLAREKFTGHTFPVNRGDMLYLFTDGYADQKGGPQRKKFFGASLRNLLKDISHLPCGEQRQKLSDTLEAWKGSCEQIDDILVTGVRIT